MAEAAAEGLELAPAVPVGFVALVPDEYAPEDPDIEAFVRMKLESVELALEPVVPVVPVAPEVALAEPR